MLVEDCAQKYRVLVGRLHGPDALFDEMMASYFLNGLKMTIRVVIANVDIVVGFDDLMNVVLRVEKGFTKKKKKTKKK